jgi:hypothetical protein
LLYTAVGLICYDINIEGRSIEELNGDGTSFEESKGGGTVNVDLNEGPG